MKRMGSRNSGLAGVGALLWVLGLAGSVGAESSRPTVADLVWMAGCWEQVGETRSHEECWLPPRAGTLIGVHRTTRTGEGSGGGFEFLRVVEDAEGVVYLASPGGREPTPFRLTSSAPGRAVFENPEHDFPQKLTYRLEDGVLRVRVEAGEGEQARGFELRLARTDTWP